jgi:DNA-binding PadR family transcriptional regulator
MAENTDVWQGTLALMVLRTLEALGPLHGYGIARRIEQTWPRKEPRSFRLQPEGSRSSVASAGRRRR